MFQIKEKTMKQILSLMAAIFLFFPAVQGIAADDCETVQVKEGKVYTIKTALYKGTHIQLPERLIFPPQAGNGDLWTVEGEGHHIMVQPNTSEPEGKKTNLTLITESNTAYHFNLIRVQFDQAHTCVIIKKAQKFLGTSLSVRGTYQTPDDLAKIQYQKQIRQLQTQIKKEKGLNQERMDAMIAKYRSMTYTRYDWNKGRGFKGTNLVTDVFDDGRWTFIRVTPDHRGLLTVKAKIDGKEEVLEYKTDSDYLYKISGIYPEFTLVYGKKNKIEITRRDNHTNGTY